MMYQFSQSGSSYEVIENLTKMIVYKISIGTTRNAESCSKIVNSGYHEDIFQDLVQEVAEVLLIENDNYFYNPELNKVIFWTYETISKDGTKKEYSTLLSCYRAIRNFLDNHKGIQQHENPLDAFEYEEENENEIFSTDNKSFKTVIVSKRNKQAYINAILTHGNIDIDLISTTMCDFTSYIHINYPKYYDDALIIIDAILQGITITEVVNQNLLTRPRANYIMTKLPEIWLRFDRYERKSITFIKVNGNLTRVEEEKIKATVNSYINGKKKTSTETIYKTPIHRTYNQRVATENRVIAKTGKDKNGNAFNVYNGGYIHTVYDVSGNEVVEKDAHTKTKKYSINMTAKVKQTSFFGYKSISSSLIYRGIIFPKEWNKVKRVHFKKQSLISAVTSRDNVLYNHSLKLSRLNKEIEEIESNYINLLDSADIFNMPSWTVKANIDSKLARLKRDKEYLLSGSYPVTREAKKEKEIKEKTVVIYPWHKEEMKQVYRQPDSFAKEYFDKKGYKHLFSLI